MVTVPSIVRPLSTQAPVRSGTGGSVAFIRKALDPAISGGMLVVATLVTGHSLGRSVWALALLTFLLTYPGEIPYRSRLPGQLRRIFANWALVVGVLLALGIVFGVIGAFDAQQLALWFVATPTAQALAHWAGPRVLARVFSLRRHNSAIVVGANPHGRALVRAMHADESASTRFTAYFDDREAHRLGAELEVPVQGSIDSVADYVRAHHIDQIYIALPMASQPRNLRLLNDLRDTTASIFFVPDIFLYDLIQARVDLAAGMPVVAVCETPFHGTTGVIKRLSDVLIAVGVLLLAGLPMIGIALAIRLGSPGPAIFRQRRYGLDGREIVVWKFRTMYVQEDGGQVRQATVGDERITPIGRLLRCNSLDELPQFFNVLQGRMSVVGPRPHAVSHNEIYRKLISGYMIRHKVKPGITGWAQVNGARGETDTIDKMKRRIEFDLEYLRNWSLRLDLQIVARTVLKMVRRDPEVH
jgi:putative colanic acid biosynthesis UDP-glucose lipid carrier transferase